MQEAKFSEQVAQVNIIHMRKIFCSHSWINSYRITEQIKTLIWQFDQ